MLEKTEQLFKVFADRNRLRILSLLYKRKMCVCELAHILGVTQPSVSRHLKQMKKAGLVADERDGFWTNYFLLKDKPEIRRILACMEAFLAEDSVIQADRKKGQTVDRRRLCCL